MADETMRSSDSSGTDERETTGTDDDARTSTAVDDAFVQVPDAAAADQGERGTDAPAEEQPEALLERDRAESFRRRWDEIQTGFVDRPRESVEQADRLVVEVVQQLQASFTLARERLESQWSEGEDASTEDLRLALRRYRSFFDRLLSA